MAPFPIAHLRTPTGTKRPKPPPRFDASASEFRLDRSVLSRLGTRLHVIHAFGRLDAFAHDFGAWSWDVVSERSARARYRRITSQSPQICPMVRDGSAQPLFPGARQRLSGADHRHPPKGCEVNDLLNHLGETFRLAPGETPDGKRPRCRADIKPCGGRSRRGQPGFVEETERSKVTL